ncbi:hypothetical protein C8034_v002827 [Colletotrichum sidae]|uniref:Uncharacterized protein n=1 Tax=Colletotrichum sidae TaxID=1347389 RepID=A0A4V3I3T4_9PEZI|nr:hypothetical protein C8034_v002827 [Colletotrichum sidae]
MSRERPVAIYVLTDGHWDLGRLDDCDVGGSIARLVSHMWNGRKQRNWAIVQFIRFHQQPDSPADQLGQFRLSYLDNRLKEQQELAYDIVDTRDYENDLRLILEGAISYESDQSQSLGAHQPC